MYSMQTSNGLGGDTINPAALSSTGMRNPLAGQSGSVPRYAPSSFLQDDFSLSHSTLTSSSAALANQTITPDTSPRGVKRSRSPDIYGDISHGDLGDDDNSKPRKRGRPTKQTRAPGTISESPVQSSMPLSQNLPPQTPQSQVAALPTQLTSITPTQASPPKATPTKTVIKALPTVRDHTTDQLGPEGDEYIPREYDEAGEKKVTLTGQLLEGRDYRCRTFFVPNRGDKLFMLATECARVLGYRDSYLLFNKNRSLYKIIATQAEKEDLIHQEILPFSYRSRQIAIVTARSMFRQFGSRVIVNGRRVRDDYWETKARKQGFTEEDLAGEKRPGAAKARESAAAEASATASMTLGHHGDIVYSNNPGHFGVHPQPQTVQPGMIGAPGGATTLPMITLAPEQPDMRLRDYSNIQRPRQEITGPPYQDRTQASPPQELLTHAHQAAEYNKQINLQRNRSGEYLDRRWRQPHELPPSNIAPLPMGSSDGLPSTQALPSPRTTQSNIQQSIMAQQTPQHLTSSQSYTQPPPPQHPIAQSPMRGVPPGSIRPDQMGRSPSLPLGPGNLGQGGNPYTFPQQGSMWPPGQGQQASTQQFSTYASHNTQPSPHIQQSPHQPPSQLRHSTSNPQMQPTLQYAGMQGMSQGYPAGTRGLYQPDPNSQQFMQPSTSGPQPGASWAGQQPPASGSTWWAGQPQ